MCIICFCLVSGFMRLCMPLFFLAGIHQACNTVWWTLFWPSVSENFVKGHSLSNKRFSAVHYAGSSTTKLIFQKWITLWSWKTSLCWRVNSVLFTYHWQHYRYENRDLLATWQIDGAYFECVDSKICQFWQISSIRLYVALKGNCYALSSSYQV